MTEKQTALYQQHVQAEARMTPFAGWLMPLHYGSQVAEHHQVRRSAGMFDVSHMSIFDLEGDGALDLLLRVFANDAAKAVPGKALYGVLLNEAGGILDDVIVYGRQQNSYRLVSNAATHDRVRDWLATHCASFTATVRERTDLAMIAVQGPQAIELTQRETALDIANLASFATVEHDDWLIARTGYTGEDGVEIMLPNDQAAALWQNLRAAGVEPTGLAARDTLRLEAGLNLYGQDMNEHTTPLESNLGWSVAWEGERDFIGRASLETLRAQGSPLKLTGLVLKGKGVVRNGYRVRTGAGAGEGIVTSGLFSPTLGYSIALARLPRRATGSCTVEIRGVEVEAWIVRPPFVRQGKKVYRESKTK